MLALVRVRIELAVAVEQIRVPDAALDFYVVDDFCWSVKSDFLLRFVDVGLALPEGIVKDLLVRLDIVVHERLDAFLLHESNVQADSTVIVEIKSEKLLSLRLPHHGKSLRADWSHLAPF